MQTKKNIQNIYFFIYLIFYFCLINTKLIMAECNTASFCKFSLDYDNLFSRIKNTSLVAEINADFDDNKLSIKYEYDFTIHNSDYYQEKNHNNV